MRFIQTGANQPSGVGSAHVFLSRDVVECQTAIGGETLANGVRPNQAWVGGLSIIIPFDDELLLPSSPLQSSRNG
jgi:hypothetical protein